MSTQLEYRGHYGILTGDWCNTEKMAREALAYSSDFINHDCDPDHIIVETRPAKTQVLNWTPHDVHIVDNTGKPYRTYPRTGNTVRLKMDTVSDGYLPDGTPLKRVVFGEPEGLPNYQEHTYYIVSQLVKSALPDRPDLLVPGDIVRDENGNIIGCRSFSR